MRGESQAAGQECGSVEWTEEIQHAQCRQEGEGRVAARCRVPKDDEQKVPKLVKISRRWARYCVPEDLRRS
jgi:hypothetical protein